MQPCLCVFEIEREREVAECMCVCVCWKLHAHEPGVNCQLTCAVHELGLMPGGLPPSPSSTHICGQK